MNNKVKNILSFDLEFWYDSEFVKEKSKRDMVKEGLRIVLNILEKNNIKATFFVTGEIIEKYPKEIQKISKRSHEIASHGYNHKMINKMNKEEFEEELDKSIRLIKKITRKNPHGFRAPSWSVSEKEFWIYGILEKKGFRYSSSVFPVNMGLYGNGNLPKSSFKNLNSDIIEFPIIPYSLFKIKIPFSGGVYFRILPINIIMYFIKKLNQKGKRIIVYLHPWEFCEDLPKVKTSFLGKITTYYGLKNTKKKFERLLKSFKFVRFKDIL